MIPEPQRSILLALVDLLVGLEQPWVVTGSTGMALQGVPLEAHDIDLQTDVAGAYAIGQRLSAFGVTPVHEYISPRIRSHFGVFVIDGVVVEVMGGAPEADRRPLGGASHRRDTPALVPAGRPDSARAFAGLRGAAYRVLGRIERADLLRRWLEDNPGQVR